jgi:hypothetical protein
MIKCILSEIASFILAIMLAVSLAVCLICCFPYLVVKYLCKEYKEDKETYRMHGDIAAFLDKQRVRTKEHQQ